MTLNFLGRPFLGQTNRVGLVLANPLRKGDFKAPFAPRDWRVAQSRPTRHKSQVETHNSGARQVNKHVEMTLEQMDKKIQAQSLLSFSHEWLQIRATLEVPLGLTLEGVLPGGVNLINVDQFGLGVTCFTYLYSYVHLPDVVEPSGVLGRSSKAPSPVRETNGFEPQEHTQMHIGPQKALHPMFFLFARSHDSSSDRSSFSRALFFSRTSRVTPPKAAYSTRHGEWAQSSCGASPQPARLRRCWRWFLRFRRCAWRASLPAGRGWRK